MDRCHRVVSTDQGVELRIVGDVNIVDLIAMAVQFLKEDATADINTLELAVVLGTGTLRGNSFGTGAGQGFQAGKILNTVE